MEHAQNRAARLARPDGALTDEQRAAFADSEAALRRRVQEGGRRAQVALAAGARRRLSAMRQALGRIVWALTALLTEQSANTVLPFPRVVGELERLRDVEMTGGSERRARSLSTALWLLRKCTPPAPPRRQADEAYAKAVAMLEWLLVRFDDHAAEQVQADEQAEMDAPQMDVQQLDSPQDTLDQATAALHLGSQRDLLQEFVRPQSPNAADRNIGLGVSRRTVKGEPSPARQAEPSSPKRSSVQQPRGESSPPSPIRRSLSRRGSKVFSGSPLGHRSTASRLSLTKGVATAADDAEDTVNDPAGHLLSTLVAQHTGDLFGEVVLSQPRGADSLFTQATSVSSQHHTNQPHFRPTAQPVKITGGRRLTILAANSPMDSRMLEEERDLAEREGEARTLAQLHQREQAQSEQAERAMRETEERMREYQEAKMYGAADARSGADLEAQLAVDQRLWAHNEAEARRREVEEVLHRERELAAAQRERLGLTSQEMVASLPAVRQVLEAPATLSAHPVAVHVTPEMVALINDLHASFSLFSTPTVNNRDDPPMVVSGELIGGGEVPAADIELAIGAFGLHYLAPSAQEAIASSLHKMKERNITFTDYVQTMLTSMAEPNQQVQPQSLASLYTAFVLFDDGGNGMVRMSEVELVLQALSCYLDTSELQELLNMLTSRLETRAQPVDCLLPFYSFLELLVPGRGLNGAYSMESAQGRSPIFAPSTSVHPGERAPSTALSEKIASFPPLDEEQTRLLQIHFASYAADEASGATSDHMPASHLTMLLRAMDAPISMSELAALLRELGARDAADQIDGGLTSSMKVFMPEGRQAIIDYDTARVVYQAALAKVRQHEPTSTAAGLDSREHRAAAETPQEAVSDVSAAQFQHVFEHYVQPDGRVHVDDIELLLKELGLHLTQPELDKVLEGSRPEERAGDRLTLEQVRDLFKSAQNLSYVDRKTS
jgi:Ca2+-binding EF-hand superfamily protein